MDGGNATRFQQSCAETARHLKIPGWDQAQANQMQAVRDWLERRSDLSCLLIIDNVDVDTAEFLGENGISSYLPLWNTGSILITTRNEHLATKFAGSNRIFPNPLNIKDSVSLMQQYCIDLLTSDRYHLERLAKLLEGHPLALKQAATFISTQRMTVDEYIEDYGRMEEEKERLLRVRDSRGSFGSFKGLFRALEKLGQPTIDALALLAFLHSDDVPDLLLVDSDIDASTQALTSLKDLFITASSTANCTSSYRLYSVHRLMQQSLVDRFVEEGQYHGKREQALRRLYDRFPPVLWSNREIWSVYLPHAIAVIKHFPTEDGTERQSVHDAPCLKSVASLKFKVAECFILNGNYCSARNFASRAMLIREMRDGKVHPDTIYSQVQVVTILNALGILIDAEHLGEEAIQKARLTSRNQTTLADSSLALADVYVAQNKLQYAESFQVQAVKLYTQKLGECEPKTCEATEKLAITYAKEGLKERVVVLSEHVLDLRKKLLGPSHPDTLFSMANLAKCYGEQGRYDEKEQLELQTLALRRQVLGEKHPSTLLSLSHLAITFGHQHRYEEGDELTRKVLALQKEVLGLKHPDTLSSMANLGASYTRQERWEEAEKLYSQVVHHRTDVSGACHPDIPIAMKYLEYCSQKLARSNNGVRDNMVRWETHFPALLASGDNAIRSNARYSADPALCRAAMSEC